MMTFGWQNQFQTGTSAFMKIHNTICALTCPYPCLYSLDQLHLTLDYALQYMDLSDIFDPPDVITTASDEDIPNLEDVLQC